MNQNDLVYILSSGSVWQNNEIRYSLRSAEKHLKNFRKVFLVGKKPDFLNENVIEIPYSDIYSNKARNIMAKIYRAASDKRITNNFILFNDDYFLLKDIDALNYPYYFNDDLKNVLSRQFNSYKHYVEATIKVLKNVGKPTLNFDIHEPIIYNKVKFRKMVSSYNWNVPRGFIVKSMYCNHFEINGVKKEDHKINYPYKIDMLKQINEGKDIFSIGDKSLSHSMRAYIMNLYPEKSKYEY